MYVHSFVQMHTYDSTCRFFHFYEFLEITNVTRGVHTIRHRSFSNLRMTRLFRKDRREKYKTRSFLPLSKNSCRKRDRCLPVFSSPRTLYIGAIRPYSQVYARTSNQSGTGYQRLYTKRHISRSFVPAIGEDVFPLRRHEFCLYTVYYPVGGCRNNGVFHVYHQRRKYSRLQVCT